MQNEKTNSYIVTIVHDEEQDEYILPIPDEMWQQLGWDIGDTLIWEPHGETSWKIMKKT